MTIEKAIQQKSFENPYHKLIVNIAYTHAYINSLINKSLKPYNLSTEQYNVLRILRGEFPKAVSIWSITDRMINKMSNASRLVEKLRLKGLVERTLSPTDKRKVDVVITTKGMETLKNLDEKVKDIQNYFQHMTVKDVEFANNFLDNLRYPNE